MLRAFLKYEKNGVSEFRVLDQNIQMLDQQQGWFYSDFYN